MLACLIIAGCDVIDFYFYSSERMGSSISSPFKHLFQFEITDLFSLSKDDQESLEMRTSTINLLTYLIELLVKVGYKPTRSDYQIYKESRLFYALETLEDTRKSYHIKSLFSFDNPNSLLNICRVNLRKMLKKPLYISISKLFISQQLKSFLLLE